MVEFLRLHHIQLAIPTGSEEKCRNFWCGLLSWQERLKPAAMAERGGMWLVNGEIELHLGVENEFRPAKKAHPAFLVHDIDTLARLLNSHGYQPTWDEEIAQYKRFFVFDPVGNRLEFMQLNA